MENLAATQFSVTNNAISRNIPMKFIIAMLFFNSASPRSRVLRKVERNVVVVCRSAARKLEHERVQPLCKRKSGKRFGRDFGRDHPAAGFLSSFNPPAYTVLLDQIFGDTPFLCRLPCGDIFHSVPPQISWIPIKLYYIRFSRPFQEWLSTPLAAVPPGNRNCTPLAVGI